jgi:hypothetical protein
MERCPLSRPPYTLDNFSLKYRFIQPTGKPYVDKACVFIGRVCEGEMGVDMINACDNNRLGRRSLVDTNWNSMLEDCSKEADKVLSCRLFILSVEGFSLSCDKALPLICPEVQLIACTESTASLLKPLLNSFALQGIFLLGFLRTKNPFGSKNTIWPSSWRRGNLNGGGVRRFETHDRNIVGSIDLKESGQNSETTDYSVPFPGSHDVCPCASRRVCHCWS